LRLGSLAITWIVLLYPSAASAQGGSAQQCGNPFANHFGPFDFRKADDATKALVEKFHFTPGIEALTRPQNTTYNEMAGDVSYTLHVFPNHPRALLTMTRLGERHKSPQPPGASFTVDCYYQRAVMFRPDDTVVRGLYATYLARNGRKPEALQQLAVARRLAADNPISNYSIGAVYFELGEFDLAVQQAHKAAALGFPSKGLENALKNAKQWREPSPGNPPDSDANAASSPTD
jgi:tetratricopeptide (TPR) repeat protein